MKKYLISMVILFISLTSFSQEFDNVPISGDVNVCITRLKTKGYKLVQIMDDGVSVLLKGRVANIDIELMVLATPKTKKVFSFSVYMPEILTFSGLQREFDRFYEIYVDKYGEPDSEEYKFEPPYYLGDGYELSALKNEKVEYSARWYNKKNLNVRLRISKFCQTQISYDNYINTELYINERNSIERNTFMP